MTAQPGRRTGLVAMPVVGEALGHPAAHRPRF